MKTLLSTLLVILPLLTVQAEDGHDHDHKAEDHAAHDKIRGPQGGRILELDDRHVEVFVTPERKVAVFFYDNKMKPISMPEVAGEVIAQASPRKKLALGQKDNSLISEETIPEGDGYQFVIRLRPNPDAKYTNFRFLYDSSFCKGCELAEYACVCEGHNH